MSEPIPSDAIRAEFPLVRRPAIGLSDLLRFGDMTIETVPEGTILHLLGKPGVTRAADVTANLAPFGPVSLREAGPGQWFAVFDTTLSITDIDAVTGDLAGSAFVVDQTHGRTRVRLSGAPVRCVLAKGTGVDLHPAALPVGRATMTLLGHIGVNLARVEPDAFELLVLRGFAESLWHDLQTMSAEFA